MRRWLLLVCIACCGSRTQAVSYLRCQCRDATGKTALRQKDTNNCINCEKRHIVSVDEDFNKLKTDPELKKHVSAILDRLKTFKVPVHPRIRIFYELLKVGMSEYAHRTADSLFVPDKYNVQVGSGNKN